MQMRDARLAEFDKALDERQIYFLCLSKSLEPDMTSEKADIVGIFSYRDLYDFAAGYNNTKYTLLSKGFECLVQCSTELGELLLQFDQRLQRLLKGT